MILFKKSKVFSQISRNAPNVPLFPLIKTQKLFYQPFYYNFSEKKEEDPSEKPKETGSVFQKIYEKNLKVL